MVKQEFTPGNTDEGEFEVSLTAREGTSLLAMDEITRVAEQEIRSIPAVRVVTGGSGAGGPSSGVNQGRLYIRLAPHKERVFSLTRLLSLHPWDAFKGNYTQSDVMQEVMPPQESVWCAFRCAAPVLHQRGRPGARTRSGLAAPDLDALVTYGEALRKKGPNSDCSMPIRRPPR
jgi:HAE1 family hydrophobic/amphiphilic exporter-1